MKETKLKELDNLTKVLFKYSFVNAYKLSENEMDFIISLLSVEYIHRLALEKLVPDKKKLGQLIDEVVEENNIDVEYRSNKFYS